MYVEGNLNALFDHLNKLLKIIITFNNLFQNIRTAQKGTDFGFPYSLYSIDLPFGGQCTVGQKEKRNTHVIYFNGNYRTEMKLIPIIMD